MRAVVSDGSNWLLSYWDEIKKFFELYGSSIFERKESLFFEKLLWETNLVVLVEDTGCNPVLAEPGKINRCFVGAVVFQDGMGFRKKLASDV